MAESTKALSQLKKAANYAKLAMHKDGPHSYKKGQGALVKVLYKFGDGKLTRKKLTKILGWTDDETTTVAKKAQINGYVRIKKADDKFIVILTEKGNEIVKKRLAAEDRAADEVFSLMTDQEVDELCALCEKVIDACEEMGVDYSLIKERPEPIKHTDQWHRQHRHERGELWDEVEELETEVSAPQPQTQEAADNLIDDRRDRR